MMLLALAFEHKPEEFGLGTHLQYMQRKSQPNWERLGIKARRRSDTDVGSTMECLLCY